MQCSGAAVDRSPNIMRLCFSHSWVGFVSFVCVAEFRGSVRSDCVWLIRKYLMKAALLSISPPRWRSMSWNQKRGRDPERDTACLGASVLSLLHDTGGRAAQDGELRGRTQGPGGRCHPYVHAQELPFSDRALHRVGKVTRSLLHEAKKPRCTLRSQPMSSQIH